jgi:hypothetical protein
VSGGGRKKKGGGYVWLGLRREKEMEETGYEKVVGILSYVDYW